MIENLLQNQVFVGMAGVSVMGLGAYLLRSIPQFLMKKALSWCCIDVEVQQSDPFFGYFLDWFENSEHANSIRQLRLASEPITEKEDNNSFRAMMEDGPAKVAERHYFYIGKGVFLFFIKKRFVIISRSVMEKKQGPDRESLHFRVFTRDRAFFDNWFPEIYKYQQNLSAGKLTVSIWKDGYWERHPELPGRPMDSVILDKEIKTALIRDVANFKENKKWYEELGIPHRRGYLFFGPPGTGKTSFTAALAYAYSMNVAIINLMKVENDEALIAAINDAPENSILLLEDIDACFQSRLGIGGARVTFSGLLNAIDGIQTKPGNIVIMTTNHVNQLDPALIRPGRIDIKVEFSNATFEMAEEMHFRFFKNANDAKVFAETNVGKSPAEIQAALIKTAFENLNEDIERKLAAVARRSSESLHNWQYGIGVGQSEHGELGKS